MEPPIRRTRLPARRWGVTAGIACIALGLLSFNAFGAFTASTNVTHDVGSGTMTLALGATGSVTNRMDVAAADIAPGDTIQRTLTVTPGGTVALSGVELTLTAPTSSLLDTDPDDGLQIVVERCSVQWTEAGPPYTYSCGGATSVVVASTSVDALVDAGTTALANELVAAANHLRVTLTFPTTADDTFQGLSTTLDFAWSGVQRAGTDQ